MRFSKYQALGNDFIITEDKSLKGNEDKIKRLCDRHYGIGADGLIIAEEAKEVSTHLFMDYYNHDGIVAEMCGNGLRSLAKYTYEEMAIRENPIKIGTRKGIRTAYLKTEDKDIVIEVTVDMGIASFNPEDLPALFPSPIIGVRQSLEGNDLLMTLLSVGNPHLVIFNLPLEEKVVSELGPKLEVSSFFPNRINVGFARVIDRQNIELRVWERGCGETLACGTGATASFAAALEQGLVDKACTVHLKGGDLRFERNDEGHILMTGSAERVFTGEIEL